MENGVNPLQVFFGHHLHLSRLVNIASLVVLLLLKWFVVRRLLLHLPLSTWTVGIFFKEESVVFLLVFPHIKPVGLSMYLRVIAFPSVVTSPLMNLSLHPLSPLTNYCTMIDRLLTIRLVRVSSNPATRLSRQNYDARHQYSKVHTDARHLVETSGLSSTLTPSTRSSGSHMQTLYFTAYNARHLHNTFVARQVAFAQGLAPSTDAHFLTPATLTTSIGAHTLTPATQTTAGSRVCPNQHHRYRPTDLLIFIDDITIFSKCSNSICSSSAVPMMKIRRQIFNDIAGVYLIDRPGSTTGEEPGSTLDYLLTT